MCIKSKPLRIETHLESLIESLDFDSCDSEGVIKYEIPTVTNGEREEINSASIFGKA